MPEYIGTVCAKHPELLGLRAKNRQCKACNLESRRRWGRKRKRNKIASMVYARLRRQKILQAKPAWVDDKELKKIYDSRGPNQHVDHIVPLRGIDPETKQHIVSGLHVPWNLQVIDGVDNSEKWAWWTV